LNSKYFILNTQDGSKTSSYYYHYFDSTPFCKLQSHFLSEKVTFDVIITIWKSNYYGAFICHNLDEQTAMRSILTLNFFHSV